MAFDHETIARRISEVAVREMGLSPEMARDVGFHMTDWLDNLDQYERFCRSPQSMSDAAVHEVLLDFLIHVPNHIAAAGKLYADSAVTDIFGVGATTEDDA